LIGVRGHAPTEPEGPTGSVGAPWALGALPETGPGPRVGRLDAASGPEIEERGRRSIMYARSAKTPPYAKDAPSKTVWILISARHAYTVSRNTFDPRSARRHSWAHATCPAVGPRPAARRVRVLRACTSSRGHTGGTSSSTATAADDSAPR